VWEGDNGDRYPMAVSSAQGGASEYVSHNNAGALGAVPAGVYPASGQTLLGPGPRYAQAFNVMSNELSTPKILNCPSNTNSIASSFTQGSAPTNFNCFTPSYFVGGDATETDPQMILAGDMNIGSANTSTTTQNPASVRFTSQVIYTTGNGPAWAWTVDNHNKVGNLLMADGSSQQLSVSGLRTTLQNGTNTVYTPVYNFY